MNHLPRRLSEPGPLMSYINMLEQIGMRDEARIAVDAVRSVLGSKEGAILLELLEKAILERSIPISSDPRALDANNAQSFIPLDLRRILSDEFDDKPDKIPTNEGARGRGRPRGRST